MPYIKRVKSQASDQAGADQTGEGQTGADQTGGGQTDADRASKVCKPQIKSQQLILRSFEGSLYLLVVSCSCKLFGKGEGQTHKHRLLLQIKQELLTDEENDNVEKIMAGYLYLEDPESRLVSLNKIYIKKVTAETARVILLAATTWLTANSCNDLGISLQQQIELEAEVLRRYKLIAGRTPELTDTEYEEIDFERAFEIEGRVIHFLSTKYGVYRLDYGREEHLEEVVVR